MARCIQNTVYINRVTRAPRKNDGVNDVNMSGSLTESNEDQPLHPKDKHGLEHAMERIVGHMRAKTEYVAVCDGMYMTASTIRMNLSHTSCHNSSISIRIARQETKSSILLDRKSESKR